MYCPERVISQNPSKLALIMRWVLPTGESDTAVSVQLRSETLQCPAHRGVSTKSKPSTELFKGAVVGSNHGKNGGRKSRDALAVSFFYINILHAVLFIFVNLLLNVLQYIQ